MTYTLKEDFNNPFGSPQRGFGIFNGRGMQATLLLQLGRMAENWLEDIGQADSRAAAAFNRSCLGRNFRVYLNNAEMSFGLKPRFEDRPEKRLLDVAEAALEKGHKLKSWKKFLPQLKTIAAAAETRKAGDWKTAQIARDVLSHHPPTQDFRHTP